MPWLDKKTNTIRSIGGEIVASFVDYHKQKTWWYLAEPKKNVKFKYPNNLRLVEAIKEV